jgi:hypothetical protein
MFARAVGPSNDTMHRQLIVAIETEVCDRQQLRGGPPLSHGETEKIVTVWTNARAIFRHFCSTLSRQLLVVEINNVKASGNRSEAPRGDELPGREGADPGFHRCPELAVRPAQKELAAAPKVCLYGCGEAGKIKDLITTGTEPDDGIKLPMSMKSKSLREMPSMEITGFCNCSSS